ncbi:MAG: hypothetical protein R3A48_15670 [Polyangiales bacterium]
MRPRRHRRLLIAAALVGCAPGDIQDDPSQPSAPRPVEASGGLVIEAPARAPRCAVGEYYLGNVTGAMRDELDRPLAGAWVTVCGTTCVAGETGADGRFDVAVNGCFGASSEYAHGAAFAYEGLGERQDLFVDFNPQDLSVMGTVRFTRPLYAIHLRRGGVALPSANPDAAVTMVDGLGFALRYVPSTVSYPLNAEEGVVRAIRLPVNQLPPYEGAAPLVAYAISPAGAELSAPARVEFPNVTNLRPRSTVDIVAVGNHSSYGRPPVGVLERVDVGYVSDDGRRIIAANGLRFFGTVGYRAVAR